jgi:hypothetical protein
VGGFQFLLILDQWGISFHAVVVYGLGKNLLVKSVLGRCGASLTSSDAAAGRVRLVVCRSLLLLPHTHEINLF